MNKRISLFVIAVLAILPGVLYAQVVRDWVARYTGTGGNTDSGNTIAVDASGYAYVAGMTAGGNDAFLLIKYDPNGNIVWSKRDAGDNLNLIQARKIKLDANGNIYLAGWGNESVNHMMIYAVVKYDNAGNRLWSSFYNGPGDFFDVASDLAVDNAGNVYVTGGSTGIGTNYDFATVKYDSLGNQIWVQRYNSPGDGSDSAHSIGIDSAGNIYVSGNTQATSGCALIKYDPDGNQLWLKDDCPSSGTALVIDSSDNIYICGNYEIKKYNSDGALQWTAPSIASIAAIALADTAGIYATGSKYDGTSYYFVTERYDANGNQIWSKTYATGNGSPKALVVDAYHYVTVTGSLYNTNNNYDYLTIKYDQLGNRIWVRSYDGPGNKTDMANAIAADAEGNIYVTGDSQADLTWDDCYTIKYDPSGNKLWDSRYNGSTSGLDIAVGVDTDNSGNVYVTGYSRRGMDNECVTIKYNSIGEPQWIYEYRFMQSSNGFGLKLDQDGNPIIIGYGKYANETERCFAMKWDSSGNVLWNSVSDLVLNQNQECQFMTIDTDGNIYGGGTVQGTSDYKGDYLVVKFDAQGNYLWKATYDGPAHSYDYGGMIAVDADQNVYQTGISLGSASSWNNDIATVKYDSGGNLLWAQRWDNSSDDGADRLALDSNADVYVTGGTSNSQTGDDIVTLKYNSDGNLLWSKIYDGPSHGDDLRNTLTLDAASNVLMLCMSNNPDTGEDLALVKYDSDGNQLWSRQYNSAGSNNDEVDQIMLDSHQNIYLSAESTDASGYYDWWMMRLADNGDILWSETYDGPAHKDDFVVTLKIDDSGNVYANGGGTDTASGMDYTTIKYTQLPVLQSGKPLVDDSQSITANGIIEPDEWVNLIGNLTNTGIWTAFGVTGTLFSNDLVIITDPHAIYPDIPTSGSAFCQDCYTLVAPSSIRPSTHWDIIVMESPQCTNCQSASYDFQYHIGASFADVPPAQLFYPYVETAIHHNIIAGCDITHYCPSGIVQRQQIAKMLCKAMEAGNPGSCSPSACNSIFVDVPSSNPFCSFIEALYSYNITGGCQSSPLLYCPSAGVRRDALAKFVCLSMNHANPDSCTIASCTGIFSDVGSGNPFCSYIEAIYNLGIIIGCGTNTYCPGNYVTRDQITKFIVNAFHLSL